MRKIINIALVLALLAGLCIPAFAAGKTFTDVPAGNWAYSFVQRAADQGWVSGVGGGRYSPNSHVTYSQFAVMLGNAIYPSDMAAQAKTGQWWEPACSVAAQHGLWADTDMQNRPAWNSVANKAIPREQMAQVMYNALVDVGAKLPSYEEYSEVALGIGDIIDTYHDDAVAVCYAMGLLSGNGNGYFNPHDPMTRAQAAVVLCRMYDAVRGTSSDLGKPTQPVETPNTIQVYDGGKMIALRCHVRNEVKDNPQCNCKFYFTIEPKEEYSGVLMPDDDTAVIEGTGDATFEKICFTAPGTYSFRIYEEEGMEHYRYDAREWELTVTVTGTAGAPAGALGGQYDTSVYTVPADANKDGWLTEDEVAAVIAQIQEEYPVGTPWGEDKFYRGSGWPNGGYACAAFAQMASDRIFGDLPTRVLRDVYSIRIGDVTKSTTPHWAMVRKLWWYDEDPAQGAVYDIAGNVGGEIGLGVDAFGDLDASLKRGGLTIWTRYPVGDPTPSTIDVASYVYVRGDTTSTEGASFITTCLDTPTWSSETKEKARKIMAGMTLEEKVGQLFLLHYPGDGSGTVAQATDLIDKYHPGGYLVFSAMFEGNTTAGVQKKIADTQAASDIPLLFTVDEEGGLAQSGRRIVRISDKSQYGHDPFLSPQELKEKGGLSAVAADTIDKASFLKNLGLNVNHAPVADVSAPGGMMYGRTWGGTALENAEYVEALVGAADGTGVGTTMKHFPGYGATSADTHNGFAINDLTWDDFIYGDLLPFHAGIGAGGRAVMVTHNTINCLDGTNPASLSPAVYDMLRDSDGANFDGVAMTDDLAMSAITKYVGEGQASLRALQAGADMAMTSTPDQDVPVALAAARNGSFALSDIEAKCMRVLCWKLDMGLIKEEDVPPTPPDPVDYEAKFISSDGVTEKTGTLKDMWNLAAQDGGKIELYQDVHIQGADVSSPGLTVPKNTDIELDLMGHTLSYSGYDNAIVVNSGAVFTLSDSTGEITKTALTAPSSDTVYSNRRLVYNEASKDETGVTETGYAVDFSQSGTLYGRSASSLVYLDGGTFNLAGGVIENSEGNHAVSSNAEKARANIINMTGGAILGSGVSSGTNRGGGVSLSSGTFNMTGGCIAGNTGVTTGGGVFLDGSATANINGGVIAGNKGGVNGGGVYASSGCTVNIKDAVITGNTAEGHGGNIYGVSAAITLDGGASVAHGHAKGCGGGIYGWGSTSVLAKGNSLIYDNYANNAGGGICLGLAA